MIKHDGFTLFELMIAIAVVAILSTIAVPAYQGYIQKAALTDMLQAMTPYKLATELCFLQQGALQDCNNNSNGINPSRSTRYVDSINVALGVITLVGKGSLSELTLALTPKIDNTFGDIQWQRRCVSANNLSLKSACEDIFRFDEME